MLQKNLNIKEMLCWLLGFGFMIISVLNLILVHPVPAIIYFLFSLICFPITDKYIVINRKMQIPFKIKILLAFLLLWGTLAVTDLADILGL